SLASRGDLRQPSVLFILPDKSESMTIRDAFDQKSRWEEQLAILRKCEPMLRELREDQNVTIVPFQFAEDISEFDPQGKADGKRTDFGQMLNSLYERYKQERRCRGLVILSDGADNGTRYPALTEAAKFRGLPCPIYTFALGKITTTAKQLDIAFTSIVPEPSPVPAKGKLTVKGLIDAPGFEGKPVHVELFIDNQDKPVADQEVWLE